ncbi:MAG TPA: C39 family peptidase, partial [Patescibacteria group bacterium]
MKKLTSPKQKIALLVAMAVCLSLIGILVWAVLRYVEIRQDLDFVYSDRDISIPLPGSSQTAMTPDDISSSSVPTTVVTAPSPSLTPVSLQRVNLDVPFTSQAPESNWDSVHEETCEEASLLMAQWWAQGKTGESTEGYMNRIPPAVAEASLQDLVTWQKQTFGYFEDTTATETLRVAQEKLGLKTARLLTDVTQESLKAELAAGNILLVPAAGQVLKNPYFKQPGPPYHMILVRGYNDTGFITNDPGTRRGEGFVYSYENLLDSIHDWTGDG